MSKQSFLGKSIETKNFLLNEKKASEYLKLKPLKGKKEQQKEELIENKRELDEINQKLEEVREETQLYKERIKGLFEKSNLKETELKNYIATLNSKMYNYDIQYDSKIDDLNEDILEKISEIQKKVKKEILYTKKEMEDEVTNKFTQAEQNQSKLMMEKIEEQKKIFDKMSNVRKEIEKINKNFESVDAQCESLSKENESLRILVKSLGEDNESLKNKLKALINENNQIKQELESIIVQDPEENSHELSNNDDFNDENNKSNSLRKNSEFELKKIERSLQINQDKSKILSPIEKKRGSKIIKEKENNLNNHDEKNEKIIFLLKKKIEKVKKETKSLNMNYCEEIKQKNESQQLLQKCIEDLKFDINKVMKDIDNFRKMSSNKKNYEAELNAKLSNLQSLEQKFKLLSFIYDNGFQTNKLIKKNKLFENN